MLTAAHGLGIDVTLTVKSGLNHTGQTNGFRVNFGGMDNDPVLQLSLMKQAERLLGDSHIDHAQSRQLTFWSLFAVLAILGIL